MTLTRDTAADTDANKGGKITYAHCYRSGKIEVSEKEDLDGAIRVAQGAHDELIERLSGRARLAYDNQTWLVPGLPEADTEKDAELALDNFCREMKKATQN